MVCSGGDLFVANETGATDDGSIAEVHARSGKLVTVLSDHGYHLGNPDALALSGRDQ
jgi:hypothetical protein